MQFLRKSWWCLLAAAITAGASASGQPTDRAPVPRLPRDNLLVFRGPRDEQLPVQTVADWQQRRGEILRGMQTVMGPLPGAEKRCALEVQIDGEVDCGSYVRRRITYSSEPGSRVPAYLLVPKRLLASAANHKAPAVLCLHGTDNVVGHGTVVGLGPKINRQYAQELAERGFVTLAPSYPLLAQYQPDIRRLGWDSGTLKAVWDNIRGLDLLAALPYVDSRAFGAIGHSLGGHNAVFTAVYDERISVVVSSCGLDSFVDYYNADDKVWQSEQGWTQTRYMPRLSEYRRQLAAIPFDFHELVGALAPRHVLLIAPSQDHNFRSDSVDRIAIAAQSIYRLFDAADHLRVLHPDCGHDFPVEMREASYELLSAVLRRDGPRHP